MDTPLFSSSMQVPMLNDIQQQVNQQQQQMRNNNWMNNQLSVNQQQNYTSQFQIQQQQQVAIPSFRDLLSMHNLEGNNMQSMNNNSMNNNSMNNNGRIGRRGSVDVSNSTGNNFSGNNMHSLNVVPQHSSSNETSISVQVSNNTSGDDENSQFHPISCIGCRKVHKKCDKQLPSCKKCVAKGVACIYENPKKRGKGSLSYPHKKKKLDTQDNKEEEATTTELTKQEVKSQSESSSSTIHALNFNQLFALRIPNLVELYFTFLCTGHPFIRKTKLEYFINNFLLYFENGVDTDQIHFIPNELIESVGELKCIYIFYLSVLALGHQLLANTDTSDRIAKMCELESAKLSVDYCLNFYWACSAFHLCIYYNGSGALQKARYYVRFADFYCLENPNMTDILQKNLLKRKVLSVGYYGDSANEFAVFFGNMPNVFEMASNQKLEDVVLPGTMEYLKTANVTPQNFLLFRQVIDISFAVTTQYRTELMKKMTDCHSPIFFTSQIVSRLMVVNGFKLLFLLKVPEHAKELAEEIALRVTLLAEHDIFSFANSDVSISVKTTSRFHLDICKEIKEGKRKNNAPLKTSNGKVLNVDYFSILEKDLKAMKIHTQKFVRVRNECHAMMQEMEEMLERHRQRRNLAIVLDSQVPWVGQSQFPDQQDPVLSSVLTYLNELNQQMPNTMTTTPQEEFDSEWRDLFTDSIL